jgi:hypothetical protein
LEKNVVKKIMYNKKVVDYFFNLALFFLNFHNKKSSSNTKKKIKKNLCLNKKLVENVSLPRIVRVGVTALEAAASFVTEEYAANLEGETSAKPATSTRTVKGMAVVQPTPPVATTNVRKK